MCTLNRAAKSLGGGFRLQTCVKPSLHLRLQRSEQTIHVFVFQAVMEQINAQETLLLDGYIRKPASDSIFQPLLELCLKEIACGFVGSCRCYPETNNISR